jgi:hypothetical protein
MLLPRCLGCLAVGTCTVVVTVVTGAAAGDRDTKMLFHSRDMLQKLTGLRLGVIAEALHHMQQLIRNTPQHPIHWHMFIF